MIARPTLLAALLLLGACGGADGGRATEPSSSEPPPGDYVSTGLPSPYETEDVLRMTVRPGEVAVQATCNTLSASAEWSGGTLELSNLGGTEMGCPGEGFAQDDWLAGFLTASPAYDVSGDSFTLTRGEDRIRLVAAEQAGTPDSPADAALTGTRWRLTGIEEADGDSVSMMAVPRRVKATLQIDRRSIQLEAGCNSGGGRVMVRGGELRLRNVALTVMGCLDPRAEIEEQVSRVLLPRGRVDWSITGNELRLTRGDLSLVYRAH